MPMDCETCKEIRQTVPYIVHESAMARSERHIRRLVVALIVAVVMVALCNLVWLYAWMQYDYVGTSTETVTTYQQDGEGLNMIGDRNRVNFDGTESDGE